MNNTDKRTTFLSFFADTIKYELSRLKNNLEKAESDKFEIEAYSTLKSLAPKEKEAVCEIAYDILETYTHSIMAMFDNAASLSDKFLIDVVDYDTKESLTEDYDAALHEDFIDLMYEMFES